jgi:hypothetical protein
MNSSEDFTPLLLDSSQGVCYKPFDGLLTDSETMSFSLRETLVHASHFVHLIRIIRTVETHETHQGVIEPPL